MRDAISRLFHKKWSNKGSWKLHNLEEQKTHGFVAVSGMQIFRFALIDLLRYSLIEQAAAEFYEMSEYWNELCGIEEIFVQRCFVSHKPIFYKIGNCVLPRK
jgi:hypothetical protein